MVSSVVYAWHLGTMAGPALVDLLFGEKDFSGRLPITFLRDQGQIPTYYNHKNTGRPNNTHSPIPFHSDYIDVDPTPFLMYGTGLSYAPITFNSITIDKKTVKLG